MTQEEKQLLLKDLCARLPYRLKFQSYHSECGIEGKGTFDFEIGDDATLSKLKDLCESGNNKPYLRSMSSMTKKERLIYEQRLHDVGRSIDVIDADDVVSHIDWLLSHHFDFRGLIYLGLAFEAPKNMYKIE